MRILMLSLPYHGYPEKISDELRALGHTVVSHEIQLRDFTNKSMRIISPRTWQSRMNSHHKNILKLESNNKYDALLFIQCHQLSPENMQAFRLQFSESRFILYNWDSISNHDFRPHMQHFDQIFTFDPEDARTYNLKYLPLFCSREFQQLPRSNQEAKAIYFVGNIVSQARYEAIDAFRRYCDANSIQLRTHLACTPFVATRLLRAGTRPSGLKFGSIQPERFRRMMAESTTVFDFANHVQTGYTMRIFENLCGRKKIITSNRRIKAEPFYSPDRIHVFDGLDFEGVKTFLDTPLRYPDADFPEFHIQAFARHLIDGTGHPLPPQSAGSLNG